MGLPERQTILGSNPASRQAFRLNSAAHHDLKNLVAIVDCNGVQINGWTNDIMNVEPLADK